jgi:hypothetical protein
MNDFETDAYVEAAAAWLELELSPESREAVKVNLGLLRTNAANFMEMDLDPHLDPAVVLRL